MSRIFEALIPVLFLGLPAAALIFFLVCLIRYLSFRRTVRETDEAGLLGELARRKRLFVVSLVVFLITEGAFLTFVILLMRALATM